MRKNNFDEEESNQISTYNFNEVFLPEWENVPSFHSFSTSIEKIYKGITDLRIHDAMTCKIALNTSSDVKIIMKEIVAIKNKALDPYKKYINIVNDSAKEFTDKLATIQDMITKKIAIYEEDLKKQSEMAQKEAEKLAETLGLDIGFVALKEETIGSTSKTIVSHKIEKDFSVVNESLIPREYLMIDEDKIKKAIKMGISAIPGIEIKEIKKVILRKR